MVLVYFLLLAGQLEVSELKTGEQGVWPGFHLPLLGQLNMFLKAVFLNLQNGYNSAGL